MLLMSDLSSSECLLLALRVDSLQCQSSEAIGAKRTSRKLVGRAWSHVSDASRSFNRQDSPNGEVSATPWL
jgi:hypothetical protein